MEYAKLLLYMFIPISDICIQVIALFILDTPIWSSSHVDVTELRNRTYRINRSFYNK